MVLKDKVNKYEREKNWERFSEEENVLIISNLKLYRFKRSDGEKNHGARLTSIQSLHRNLIAVRSGLQTFDCRSASWM